MSANRKGNTTGVASASARRLSTAVLILASMLLTAVPLLATPATSDPWYADDGDMTRAVSWNFTDPLDYSLSNAVITGGRGQLAPRNFTVEESTKGDFENGTSVNLDLDTFPDTITINDTSLPITRLVLQPGPEGKDNYLDEWFPGWTPSDGSDLDVNGMYDPAEIYNKRDWIIMQFDLSAVPAGATVMDAKLFLYEIPCKALPLDYAIRAVNSSWVESYPGVSWTMRDPAQGWTKVGGDYSIEVFDSGTIDGTSGWHEFDLTRLVDLWSRGAIPNYGFMMTAAPTLLDSTKSFSDCESGKVNQRPKLIINYTLGSNSGSYESKALGQGLNSTFTIASWASGACSKATDEFGSALSPRWSWLSDPSLSGGSVDFAVPGWMNITGSLSSTLTSGVNFLYQNITGDFRFETSLREHFTDGFMGAGIMIRDSAQAWLSFYKTGVQEAGLVVAELSNSTGSRIVSSLAWPDADVQLMMERSGTTYSMFASSNGVNWTTVGTVTPRFDFMRLSALGLCVFSGGPALRPSVEFDFARIDPLSQTMNMEIMARTGNSTVFTDPSWGPWSMPLSPSSGAIINETGRYMQYRVSVSTIYDWISPGFSSFECHFERYEQSGTIITGDIAPPALATWQTMIATQDSSRGRIQYAYSNNHGSTWVNLGSGSSFNIPLTSPPLMIRITITTYDTLLTPSVETIVLNYSITHAGFYVSAPQSVVAGQVFSLYIEPKDTSNNTATWTGVVSIAARDASGLSNASAEVYVTVGGVPAGGHLTITNERYDFVETIRIVVTGGGVSGISNPISIIPGPLHHIQMDPYVTRLPEGNSTTFTAAGYDVMNNTITGYPITWHADSTLGYLNSTSGSSVILTTATYASGGYLNVTIQGVTLSRYIEVAPLQEPPQIDPVLPMQTKIEDFGSWTFDLSPYVSDREDNISDLKWYVVNESIVSVSGENRTGDMTITFTTLPNLFGIDALEVRVVDTARMMARGTITVNITSVNDPPRIDPIAPIVVRYGDPYSYNLVYYVHDVETPSNLLTISVDASSVPYVRVDGLWLTLTYPVSLNGTQQSVVVTVSDGDLEAETLIVVTIDDDYVPRTEGSLPNLQMNQGDVVTSYFDLDNYFTDPDDDLIIYTYGRTHVVVVIQPNNTVDFYAPTSWYGTEYVVFRANDSSGARAESAMVVTVLAVNQPPTIEGVPNIVVRFGQEYVLDLSPYVSDSDEDLNDLTVTAPDSHVWVEGMLLTFLYPSGMSGQTIPLNITVGDGVLSDFWIINVTISSDNPPTVVISPPDFSFYEDDPVDYPAAGHVNDFFSDQDGDTLMFYAFTSCPNVTALAQATDGNWTIIFEPDENWNGLTRLTMRAIDPVGAIVETTVQLMVISVPDKPIISLPSTFSVVTGSHMILDITGSIVDPDSSLADFRFVVDSQYADFVTVHNGMVVFEFPEDYLDDNEESRNVTVTITVFDQDNLFSSDSIAVAISKPSVISQTSDPILWLALLASAAAASIFFLVAVMRRKKPFVVHDMMVIHNDGFLIGRLAKPVIGEIDDQVLSGMLTAVLNFVEDSMAKKHDSLTTFGFREYQVMVQRGERAFAAVVFEGDQPAGIAGKLDEFIKKFDRIYRKKLVEWTGDIDTDFAGIDVLIQSWVRENSKKANGKNAEPAWKTAESEPEAPVQPDTEQPAK